MWHCYKSNLHPSDPPQATTTSSPYSLSLFIQPNDLRHVGRMPAHTSPLTPHVRIDIETAPVRKIHIQNLTDLLHVCLLRGEYERARRAWAILIRCREVSWKSSWQWGLLLLNARNGSSGIHTSASQYSQGSGSDRSVERWLKTLRVSAKEIDKPALLLGLILHMIKHEQYRAALEELETYLSSYPYTVCGPLHTYAGLLSFYLAQPSAARPPMSSLRDSLPEDSARAARQRSSSSSSSDSDRPRFGVRPGVRESPNPGLLRNARAWFAKSLELDEKDEIATEYMRIIDRPDLSDDSDGELKDGRNNGGDRSDDTGSDTGDLDHLGRRVGQLDADEESSGLSD